MNGAEPFDIGSAWPEEDLEAVSACPCCGSDRRALLHGALEDKVFFSAPGKWQMWQCLACRAGYLDPRPTEQSIGRAYSTYYTHETAHQDDRVRSSLGRLKLAVANGYRNRCYGTHLAPAVEAGALLALLYPPLRHTIDLEHRYVPKVEQAAGAPVLDLGCGNGQWLSFIKTGGWQANGAEPDPAAQEIAQQAGLTVRRGGLSAWSDSQNSFAAITMSHVIEHVHHPREVAKTALSLLRPGGKLFIDTPNIDALGHSLYGQHWRGLEPPRHLVLFSRKGLRRVLDDAGFRDIRFHRRPSPIAAIGLVSARVRAGLSPVDPSDASVQGPSRLERLRSRLSVRRAEYLTVTCFRPA